MPRPTAEELEARAAECDEPRAATRLRLEARALRAAEFRRAVGELEALIERSADDELPELADQVAALFGRTLHRLHGAPRLAALEAAVPKEDR
jgi:hypothetical protein